MSIAGLVFSLITPPLFGIAWLRLFSPNSHWAAIIGYGYLLGIVAVTTILRIWTSMGFALNFLAISTFLIALTIIPLAVKRISPPHLNNNTSYAGFNTKWPHFIWLALLAALTLRYGGILLEVIWRPLFPWDAWMNWAPKAKTWFELKEIVPFVSKVDWESSNHQLNVYTLGNSPASTYPPLVPLIQTWTALGMNDWVDNLVNIPWLLCSLGLGLSFYGQARMLNISPNLAMTAVYLLLSMPYINVHTALSGYADLWLATFFALAGMALINFSRTRNLVQMALFIIFTIACAQTKTPGIAWAVILVSASLFLFIPKHLGYLMISFLALVVIAIFIKGGFSYHIEGIGVFTFNTERLSIPGLGVFSIKYHPVESAFTINGLIRDNWHLLGWVTLLLTPIIIFFSLRSYEYFFASILIISSIVFLYFVFFYTEHYYAAIDSTTINRAVFHLVPLLSFYILILLHSFRPSSEVNSWSD